MGGSSFADQARRLRYHFDAQVLSHRSVAGNGFRVELQRQDVTGHCEFDVTVGFCSQAHLTTTFHRVYGTTPKICRRQPGRRACPEPGTA